MTTLTTHPDWVNPNVSLLGVDGNAFAIMGFTRRALRRAGNSRDVIDAYTTEAQSSDYDHLLRTSMLYAGMMEVED